MPVTTVCLFVHSLSTVLAHPFTRSFILSLALQWLFTFFSVYTLIVPCSSHKTYSRFKLCKSSNISLSTYHIQNDSTQVSCSCFSHRSCICTSKPSPILGQRCLPRLRSRHPPSAIKQSRRELPPLTSYSSQHTSISNLSFRLM
jgi:hypothetical protein